MGVDLPLTGAGDATATAATDTITGEEYPYAKLVSGAVGSTTPINTGEGVATNAARVTVASDSAVIGAVNESAPGTDTASSGLNGRLQRVAQRLTTVIAGIGDPTDAAATGNGSLIGVVKQLRTLLGGGLPSALASDRLKVDGSGVTQPVSGTVGISGTVPVSDGGGSLTVDGTVTVQDGGGSLTVDGTVGVSAVTPGTASTNLGKAAGSAYADGHVGVGAWAVQNSDLESQFTDNDGEYSPIAVAADGAVYIRAVSLKPGTGAEDLGKAEDGTHASGDVGVMLLGVRNPEGTTEFTSGDGKYSPIATDASGAVLIAGNPDGNAVNVSIGNVAVGSLPVEGTLAHDVADSGSPVKIGGQARTTNPTAVADGDRVNAVFDDLGRQVMVVGQVRDLIAQQTATISNTSEATILSSVASTFLDLTAIDMTNESNTDVVVTIRDATAGSAVMKFALVAKGGVARVYTRPWKQTSAGNNWTAQLSTTATVHINVQAEKNV